MKKTTKHKLQQSKLDVVNKTRSNIFDWKGQFTPEFIEYLLSVYAEEGFMIADPFSGSGTVLSEAIKKGCSCTGYELNPSAFYMSKFFEYCSISEAERTSVVSSARQLFSDYLCSIDKETMVYIKAEDYREAYGGLLGLARFCVEKVDKKTKPFVINVLFLCEKDKKLSLWESVERNTAVMEKNLLSLPFSHMTIDSNLGDSRKIAEKYPNKIDLIITSPPYINVFNYHQNYRGIIECFGFDILTVAESEFGSNRKNRSNRFKTVVQYAMDMGSSLFESARALKLEGRMIWIVGRESTVRGTKFYNSKIIREIIALLPYLEIEEEGARRFINRYGETIVEDILVIRKVSETTSPCPDDQIKEVGLNQIREALAYSEDGVKDDLTDVINNSIKINKSPVYDSVSPQRQTRSRISKSQSS